MKTVKYPYRATASSIGNQVEEILISIPTMSDDLAVALGNFVQSVILAENLIDNNDKGITFVHDGAKLAEKINQILSEFENE
jgi:hypothetical protein